MRATMFSAVSGIVLMLLPAAIAPAQQDGRIRVFTITANRFAFTPQRIEVHQGDVVLITLKAVDMPHVIAIDAYRIAKRAAAGKSAVIQFRADQIGTFPFYCNLTTDDHYKQMKGTLVVDR